MFSYYYITNKYRNLMPKVVEEYREIARRKIIEAAAEVFYHKGYSNAGMDEIARKVGVTKGTLYLYFRNKQDLLVETCKINQTLLVKTLNEQDAVNIDEWIEHFIEQELSLPDHVKFYWILALNEMDTNPEIKRILMDEYLIYVGTIKNILKRNLKKIGLSANIDLEDLSKILVGFHNGILISIMQGLHVNDAKNLFVKGFVYLINGSKN